MQIRAYFWLGASKAWQRWPLFYYLYWNMDMPVSGWIYPRRLIYRSGYRMALAQW
jgi:hypothetical protein